MTVEDFSSDDVWTCPAGVTSITVECWGAGAAGGAGQTQSDFWGTDHFGGSGGGAGAYARATVSVTPGVDYDVFVGTGGTAGASPSGGGDSYFDDGSAALAKGGSAGESGSGINSRTGGAGGLASSSVGDVTRDGGSGGDITTVGYGANAASGGGASPGPDADGVDAEDVTYGGSEDPSGATAPSGGGDGGDGHRVYGSTAGGAGVAPGGGGGGGMGTANGGAGADGLVRITYGGGGTEALVPSTRLVRALRSALRGRPRAIRLDGALRHTGEAPTTQDPSPALLASRVVRPPRRLKKGRSWRLEPPTPPPSEKLKPLQFFRGRARRRSQLRGRAWHVRPRMIDWGRRTQTPTGSYRVFNAAEFRFYRSSTGTPPAEGDSPFATSSSLPATPSTSWADGTWLISVSYFNGVIDSGFLALGARGKTFLSLELSSGAESEAAPAAPLDVRLEVRAGGVVRVHGVYFESGANRGDAWALAYTVDGSTPTAGSPDVSRDFAGSAGLEALVYDLPAQADGTTVKVRLEVVRGSTYSSSSVLEATADATGPGAIEGGSTWPGALPEEV